MNAREVAGRLHAVPAGELNWPALSEAVLGRGAARAETAGRIAELLERGARAEREAERHAYALRHIAIKRKKTLDSWAALFHGDTSPNIAVRSSSAARGTGSRPPGRLPACCVG